MRLDPNLSRREREIMDIVYQLGEASVSEIEKKVEDSPGYDSVRVILGILVRKGHLKYHVDNRRYIYSPTIPREKASRAAIKKLIRTFFNGSPSKAILTMLDVSSDRLTKEELDKITTWLEKEK